MDALNRDIWLFHIAFRQLVKMPDRLLAERGLSRVHHRLLWVIARSGEVSVRDLLDRLEISRQAVHLPMQQLRRAGLVTSRRSEVNRTVHLISLTPAGAEVEKALNEVQREHLRVALESAGQAGEKGWRGVMGAVAELLPAATTPGPRRSRTKETA